MLHSNHPENHALHADALGIQSIKEFIFTFNKRLQSAIEQLQNEQELLIKGNADQISEAAQNKFNSMQELSAFVANYFNEKFASSNSKNNNLENTLQTVNESCLKHKIEEWNETKDLINNCHDLTEENSIFLANRLKYTNNAIDTLFSLAGSTQSRTYDDRGHSQHPRSSRQIASV